MTKSLKIFLIVIASVIVLASAILIPLFATKVTVTTDLMYRCKENRSFVEILAGVSNVNTVEEYRINRFSSFTPPSVVFRSGYTFRGWYCDTACSVPFVSGDRISKDTTLYAKWELD